MGEIPHLPLPTRESHTPHILAVAQDCEVLTALISALLGHGFRITVVSDRATMERAVTERSIDLVLIDILVPTDEVLSLCRLVREAAGLPLILLAKRANEAHAIQALEYGADGYLIKPFSSQELLARVRAALCRSDEID